MICADTSFLISFYGNDLLTDEARRQMRPFRQIAVHAVIDYEFANALRLLVFRGKLLPLERKRMMSDYEADKAAGVLLSKDVEQSCLFSEAERLSDKYTVTAGHRAYDILQVAAALVVGATEFWSFDGKQRALAQAEGLKVGP
jgi:predicted nucleic acid-binding protein